MGKLPLKWNRIARTVSADQGLTLWENARLFGLLNMALADGYIAMVDSKNHYNYWRPVTAIQAADTDGNPALSVTRRGHLFARLLRTRTTSRVTRLREARLLKC